MPAAAACAEGILRNMRHAVAATKRATPDEALVGLVRYVLAATAARPARANLPADVVFCASPLGVLGAVQDGLGGHWYALGVKAMLDALTAMSLVRPFGPGITAAAVPMVAFQGTVSLLARWLGPLAPNPALVDTANATGGMLVFCTALLLFNVRKVQVADYLPSLLFAPLLRWLWA